MHLTKDSCCKSNQCVADLAIPAVKATRAVNLPSLRTFVEYFPFRHLVAAFSHLDISLTLTGLIRGHECQKQVSDVWSCVALELGWLGPWLKSRGFGLGLFRFDHAAH